MSLFQDQEPLKEGYIWAFFDVIYASASLIEEFDVFMVLSFGNGIHYKIEVKSSIPGIYADPNDSRYRFSDDFVINNRLFPMTVGGFREFLKLILVYEPNYYEGRFDIGGCDVPLFDMSPRLSKRYFDAVGEVLRKKLSPEQINQIGIGVNARNLPMITVFGQNHSFNRVI